MPVGFGSSTAPKFAKVSTCQTLPTGWPASWKRQSRWSQCQQNCCGYYRSVPTEKGKEPYYRIHGGDSVVEFDNQQNGANHIHSVWQEVENDFRQDVFTEHLLLYHVIWAIAPWASLLKPTEG